jgi:hypothetical protein
MTTETKDLAMLVQEMRSFQRRYLKTRTITDLYLMRKLEAEVDRRIKASLDVGGLFDERGLVVYEEDIGI